MPKRAIIYARVSTDEQAEYGYSLPSQVDLCHKHAERLGYRIVGNQPYKVENNRLVPTIQGDDAICAFVEDCSGATPIADRPMGKRLWEMLRAKQADAVIVHQVDRLSRDIVDLLATIRLWLRAGIEIYTGDIGKVESELDIVLVIKGWQGSDERRKILERTLRGKYAKARGGKVVGCHSAPYGYSFNKTLVRSRLVSDSFSINEEEARIVRLIYVWYVRGEGEGKPLSIWSITHKLSEMKISTPSETRGIRRLRPVGCWSLSTISRILCDEIYAGVWRYGKRKGRSGKEGIRPIEEQVEVNIPVIIERDLWAAAQMRREYNKKMARRNCRHDYLLRGMIRCGCGYAMTGRNIRGRYYTCGNHLKHLLPTDRKCDEKSVRADLLEDWVWQSMMGLFSKPKHFERALRKAQQSKMDQLVPKRAELDAVEKLIEATEMEATETARTMRRGIEGVVGRKLEEQAKKIEARYNALTQRRDELKAKLEGQQLTDQNIKTALQLRDEVVEGMQDPSLENKRQILEMLGAQVIIKDGQAQFTCAIPIRRQIEIHTLAYRQSSRGGE